MVMQTAFALFSWLAGFGMCLVWLLCFWPNPRRVPTLVLAAPVAAALLGLRGWASYDFAFGHWVGDISFLLLGASMATVVALFVRRSAMVAGR